MISIDYARRRARGGKKKLPGNPKQWPYEHNGLDLRDDLGIALDVMLPLERAYGLLPQVELLPHGAVIGADAAVQYFRGAGAVKWSGLVTRLEDGTEIVLYNDKQSLRRVRATLMEEFFHIRLEHPQSRIRVLAADPKHRTFNGLVEEEAYASGAAALVPYWGLRRMIDSGSDVAEIARVFDVSRDLVDYRLKVTKLYNQAHR
ncbi:MAG: ImmA/IrrE family metallo-endopeptidase [Gemmatimonadaceae bacterium]